jgi:hypothetical protein
VLWLVGLTNGLNLLDGVDGVAAGVAAIASLATLVISIGQGNPQIALMAAALLGSLLGFLVFNFYPAQIFLGDCGALFLGFFLAAISVLGNQKSATAVAMMVPIIALGVPILDTSLAFLRRVLLGKHPFQADRDHLHHRLLALGLSQPQVALLLYLTSAFLGVMALLMARATRAVAALILLCLLLLAVAAVQRLRMVEFRDLWRLARHGERRRRPPRYRAMSVRNALPLLARCESSASLRALLEEMRRDLGLVSLRIRFSSGFAPQLLDGDGEFLLADPTPPCDPDLIFPDGGVGWSGSARILVEGRPAGEMWASKPAWKHRRAGESDDELLQLIADGLGGWFAAHAWPAEQALSVSQPRPGNPSSSRGEADRRDEGPLQDGGSSGRGTSGKA